MRILHISYRMPPEPGGKERHTARVAHEQALRGHQVLVALRHGEVPPGVTAVTPERSRVTRAVARRSDPLAFAVDCARALPRLGPLDVVHLHGDHREALFLGPVARRLRVPLLVTVHGALAMRHRAIMPWAFRHVAGFTALGTRPTADLRRAGVPAHAILTISSGVDLPRLEAFRARATPEPGLIVSVGSLVPVKNHALTIEAFRRLRAVRPGMRLVIVGEGPERARLERQASTERGVEFTGHLPGDEVYRLVSRAQVFVLSSCRLSSVGEGVPTAALEALALGAAVVVSSDATLDPVVADREAYRVFRSGSADDLLACLRSVLDGDEARARMTGRGRAAVAGLDWPLVAARIEDWYGSP
ncbi:glycosyltransferase family 4 protein [Microbispora triticiradicis]|uniref:glycosyltransferase family 4 protein n=1 Tax=Microbispora triticiradicis TaxID=2200763 RepID=UPI001AD680BE|nr:glycosyltransferase family 4 protein [Microbispora triticiradicis]MBO4273653.1 glycosyltransferase [Microbispora triticiradicis]